MSISTERYVVLSSGSVIIPSDDYTEFEIKGLRFRFIFLEDQQQESESPSYRIEWHVENDHDGNSFLLVSLSNFAKLNGRMLMPNFMNLANLEEGRLLLNFTIEPLQEKLFLMHYSWYVEKVNAE